MQLNFEDISTLEKKFESASTLDDFFCLLNDVIDLQNREEGTHYKRFTEKKFKHYYSNLNKKYISFEIPKKTGGERKIDAPDRYLKKIQRRINLLLTLFFHPRKSAHGFVEKKSIVTNSEIHVGQRYLLNIDLKDFFPSVHFGRIHAVLQLRIFYNKAKTPNPEYKLTDKLFGLHPEIAKIIANFCCFNGKLPQGAPTSPIITNIVSQRLDYKLVRLAKENHYFYTRYADDISFSSRKRGFNMSFMQSLESLIKEEGFDVNHKKTRVQKRTGRQMVTGITVNKKKNLSRDYIRKIRAMLNNWEKMGYKKAHERFASFYPDEKGYIRNRSIPELESVLRGKLMFMGMVRGNDDQIFLKYQNQFNKLSKKVFN